MNKKSDKQTHIYFYLAFLPPTRGKKPQTVGQLVQSGPPALLGGGICPLKVYMCKGVGGGGGGGGGGGEEVEGFFFLPGTRKNAACRSCHPAERSAL